MNYIYPAVFYPEGDGRFSVVFPDLNDLATYGDSLADAFAMAQEACGQYLFTSLRDGEALPIPTPIESIEKNEDAVLVNLICVNLDEYARAYDDKAVKKTLSIPAWLNTACENSGINCKATGTIMIAWVEQCIFVRIVRGDKGHGEK